MDLANVQLGFDIATSVTIVGAAATFVWEQRRKAMFERKQGINEYTTSIAADKIQQTINSVSSVFVHQLVDASQNVERHFSRGMSKEEICSRIKEGHIKVDDVIAESDKFLSIYGELLETLSASRYSILPLLDALGQNEFIAAYKNDIDDIRTHYNNLGSGGIYLLREIQSLRIGLTEANMDRAAIEKVINGADDGAVTFIRSDIGRRVMSIVFDADYLIWTKSFVPDDEEESFAQAVKDRDITPRVVNVAIGLSIKVAEDVEDAYRQIITLIGSMMQSSRREVKDVICNLSSVYFQLLSRNSGEELSHTAARYKSKEYFALDEEIR